MAFEFVDDDQPSRFVFEEPRKADPKIGQPEELTPGERLLAGVKMPAWLNNIRGELQGMADPVIGGVQAVANLLPDSTGIPQAVNKRIADVNRDYEFERKQNGQTGTDGFRLFGNVVSPVNALPAGRLEAATTTLGRAGQGAAIGGAGGLLSPVEDDTKPYWAQKGAQVGVGMLTGGVLSPVLGKVADVAIARLNSARSSDIDGALAQTLKDAGQAIEDVPPDQLQALRVQVAGALQNGRIDPAAAARKADFDALGIQPTLGQITRDPKQFAREMNLRGVEGVGDPLLARFSEQGQQLQSRLPGGEAKNAYRAGTDLMESLANTDELLRKHVSGLYGEARQSAGKDLDVPMQGLAQDFANISERYGSNVPDAIRSRFASFGMDPANPTNQRRVFTLETANGLLQDINKLDPRYTNPPVSSALGEIRNALRSAIENADATGGPFAPAVRAAAERFKLHDAVPALKAAAEGSVAPDDFVRRFIVNGKTNEVTGLAKVLQSADPASYQEARAQIADELRRAAFGQNVTGDAPFAPTRYMAAIRRMGVDKLGAFFSPQEVEDILRVGRVGAFIKQVPNAAPVSTSNSNTGVVNFLAQLPVVRQGVAITNNVVRPVKQNSAVRSALAAKVPAAPVDPSLAQRNFLAYLMAIGAGGVGLAAARR